MKKVSESKTIAAANLQKMLSTIVIAVNLIGIPGILTVVPDAYQKYALIVLGIFDAIDSVYGVAHSQNKIISERYLKGDLHNDNESEDERQNRLALNDSLNYGSLLNLEETKSKFPAIDEYAISETNRLNREGKFIHETRDLPNPNISRTAGQGEEVMFPDNLAMRKLKELTTPNRNS